MMCLMHLGGIDPIFVFECLLITHALSRLWRFKPRAWFGVMWERFPAKAIGGRGHVPTNTLKENIVL